VTELPQDPDVTFLTADDEASVAGRTVQEARRSVLSPGLIVRSFGKGRVAYLAGSPEAVYYESHLEILPGFTRRLIEHLAGEPAPYDLEAPAGVYAQLAVDADNMVLHLLCDIGNKWKGLASREQYIPVPKITAQIRLPRSRKPRSVRLLRRNSPVSFRFRDGRLAVDLADVSIYEAVHIELL
jgi:hypothetical protein